MSLSIFFFILFLGGKGREQLSIFHVVIYFVYNENVTNIMIIFMLLYYTPPCNIYNSISITAKDYLPYALYINTQPKETTEIASHSLL